jgi:hypothetical protein
MPRIETCGHESKRTPFSYRGNVRDGIALEFESGDFEINSETFNSILLQFRGRTVFGGFSMTSPTPGGVGEFLAQQAPSLTPRHASFVCAVLQNENYAQCSLEGNAVVVTFNA